MADNFSYTPGTGEVGAADDIDGVKYPRVKIVTGANNTNDGDVSSANPMPVSLPAATVTTLTPPAAITGFATSAKQDTIIAAIDGLEGSVDGVEALLTTIDADTSKIPALGQALEAASVPVVLPAAQLTTLTPPAAITGFATETTLAAIKAKTDNITACNTGAVVLAAGTANVGDVDIASIAAGDNNIGNVDIVTLPGIAGDVAAGATDSGNPVKVGGVSTSTAPTLTDGQRGNLTLGSRGALRVQLTPPNANLSHSYAADNADDVAVSTNADKAVNLVRNTVFDGTTWDRQPGNSTDGTLVNLGTNNDVSLNAGTNAVGKLLPPDIDITAHTNYARKYYTSTGAATDGIVWSPAAGKRWHVTSLYFQVSADATVTFEDDKAGGDDPVLKGEYKAGSGVALSFTEKYPMASGEDQADLLVTTTAGNIYVTVVGYEI